MEIYLTSGPRDAARNEINMEHTDLNKMHFSELDRIALQLEWDILTSLNTETTHTCERQQQNLFPSAAMATSLSSQYREYNASQTIVESPLLESPETSTIASFLETPPMIDDDLSTDWTAAWDIDALCMMPEMLSFPLDTALEWPVMDNSWVNGDLNLAAPLNGCSGDVGTQHQTPKEPKISAEVSQNAHTSSLVVAPPFDATRRESFACSFCSFTAISIIKLKTHTNKHTRPFRCTAASCTYATAEKKSLQRHVLAKAKWDEDHRVAAEGLGVKEVKYRCTGAGCEYQTIRADNLRRHMAKCPLTR